MQIDWTVIPRGDYSFQQQKIYVTLKRKGDIVLNEMTWNKTGAPAADNPVTAFPVLTSPLHHHPGPRRGALAEPGSRFCHSDNILLIWRVQ